MLAYLSITRIAARAGSRAGHPAKLTSQGHHQLEAECCAGVRS